MKKRIVVKVGTNLITDEKGLKNAFLKTLVKQLAVLYKEGAEIILVSSGAVGAGKQKMKISKKTLSLSEKQAVAAIGQITLMHEYEKLFKDEKIKVAQVLLDHDDVKHKDKNANVRNTISKLLEWNVIPIINENDTVATDEIKFGDNDALAGIVAGLINADLVVILTNVEGVFAKNPITYKGQKIISYIEDIDKALNEYELTGKTEMGTGGMISKLETAKKLVHIGIPVIITRGTNKDALLKAMKRKGNDDSAKGAADGTYIDKKNKKVEGKKKWILTSLKSSGKISIDAGAKKFIVEKGKSLLAVGIKKVEGIFKFGDAVDVVDSRGNVIGKGTVNYSSEDMKLIKGKNNTEIKKLIGDNFYDEAIHRDNLFIF